MSELKFENINSTSNVRFEVKGEPTAENRGAPNLKTAATPKDVLGHKDRFDALVKKAATPKK